MPKWSKTSLISKDHGRLQCRVELGRNSWFVYRRSSRVVDIISRVAEFEVATSATRLTNSYAHRSIYASIAPHRMRQSCIPKSLLTLMTRHGGVPIALASKSMAAFCLRESSQNSSRNECTNLRITNLKSGLARMRLLFLAAICANLASRGLAARRFSFSAGHC